MGQYYVIANITKKEFISDKSLSFLYKREVYPGLKLLETAIMFGWKSFALDLLLKKSWKGDRILLIGDYSEGEIRYEYVIENFSEVRLSNKIARKSARLSGEMAILLLTNWYNGKWFTNYEKKVAISFNDVIKSGRLHPALFLAVGNGEGGGDYYGENEELVGCWQGDRVGIEEKLREGVKVELFPFRKVA